MSLFEIFDLQRKNQKTLSTQRNLTFALKAYFETQKNRLS
jgi:hypothetical protein